MSDQVSGEDTKIIKPDVTSDFATDVACRFFNISPVAVKELNSYDDRNFYMKTESGKSYLLKVSSSLGTESKAYGESAFLFGFFWLEINLIEHTCRRLNIFPR